MEKEKIIEVLSRTKDIHWSGFENEVSEAIDSTIEILKRIDREKICNLLMQQSKQTFEQKTQSIYNYLMGVKE